MSTARLDAVVTAVKGYTFEMIRPFVISLLRSGFKGHKIILADNLDAFTQDVLTNRGFKLVPLNTYTPNLPPSAYNNNVRYAAFVKWLEENHQKYRHVVWVDARDLVFQGNPTEWLKEHAQPHALIAASEFWRIKDELRANDPWVKVTVPDDYDWLREEQVLCSGTIAGEASLLLTAMKQMNEMVYMNPRAFDQAAWNYLTRKPFHLPLQVPSWDEGWCVTCAPLWVDHFHSFLGIAPHFLQAFPPPKFDPERGLALTPDGSKPFVILHQYDRDSGWKKLIEAKYRDFD